MPDLPTRFAGLILAFTPLFVHRSWRHAQLLLIGAILTPGRRTVASTLRIMGRAQDRRFVNVHRILNRAAWCPRTGGRILLGLLITAFAPRSPKSWRSTTRSNVDPANASRPRASTATRFARPIAISSRQAACVR